MNEDFKFIITLSIGVVIGLLIGVMMTIHASPMTKELEELREQNKNYETNQPKQ